MKTRNNKQKMLTLEFYLGIVYDKKFLTNNVITRTLVLTPEDIEHMNVRVKALYFVPTASDYIQNCTFDKMTRISSTF